ncbi:DNA repair protein endonuclease SAE2/CtIP C-terminus-domain-containing protein [Lentinula aff. lateritia]|uniref:DNA repair protein endonuclease SAE2/CtIP C-terminus-domain-containing protein n=1 Tax=Lentinula aff. lateritia TaxID=2804960 RepID=A0ACC1U797_9AGAR|nr:DNA repair protein endonuclease SAE2/CtIP C-terminus-domain-containing protein [Lentinula aff. lateritia]
MGDVTPNAFSSATFRERDKAVQRKHDEETRSFKVMLDKTNHANAELRASLFDLKNRSNRLVQSLGFRDLMEAQQAKILILKMENRERELEEEYTTLRKAKDERYYSKSRPSRVVSTSDSASAYRQLCKENQNLQERFDATIKANCAAEERRRKDYDKWTHFKRWILCIAELEQFKQYETEVGLDRVDRGDRAKELFRIVKGKKYKLSQLDSLEDQTREFFSRLVPTPAPIIRTENTAKLPSLTPFNPSSKVNKPLNYDNLSPSPLFDPTATFPPHAIITAPATDRSRTPLRSLPQTNPSILRAGPLKPIVHPSSATHSCPTPQIVASSDQPTTNFNADTPYPHRPQRIRSPMLASIRRNANAKASSSSSHAESSPPARRSPLSPTPMSRVRRAISPILPEMENEDRLDEQGSELPPTKYRKSTAGRRIPSGSDNAAGKDDDRFRRKSAPSALTFEENKHTNYSPRTMPHATVSRNKNTAINGMYEINPARNAGLEYQYDEVVRGREKRKRLVGEDCDDCREYYEAVGPMPPRLQPPLWKSPVKDSHNSDPKRNQPSKRNQQNRNTPSTSAPGIAAHKQNISRHRAAWARGNTPPAYWDIGFPDTQRAEEINESAREMQRKKKEMIEMEAAREGGRYRRK